MKLPILHSLSAVLLCSALSTGCGQSGARVKYQLRWCTDGQSECEQSQKGGTYVRGGFFVSLDKCNDAIRHLKFYGNKIGGVCIELEPWEFESLDL